jgi:hypothetical protein
LRTATDSNETYPSCASRFGGRFVEATVDLSDERQRVFGRPAHLDLPISTSRGSGTARAHEGGHASCCSSARRSRATGSFTSAITSSMVTNRAACLDILQNTESAKRARISTWSALAALCAIRAPASSTRTLLFGATVSSAARGGKGPPMSASIIASSSRSREWSDGGANHKVQRNPRDAHARPGGMSTLVNRSRRVATIAGRRRSCRRCRKLRPRHTL